MIFLEFGQEVSGYCVLLQRHSLPAIKFSRLHFQSNHGMVQDLDYEDPGAQLESLLGECRRTGIPAIVTLRPAWDGWAAQGFKV